MDCNCLIFKGGREAYNKISNHSDTIDGVDVTSKLKLMGCNKFVRLLLNDHELSVD